MPLLQFEASFAVGERDAREFSDAVTGLYAEHMDTGTSHVAVVMRDGESHLALGRAGADERILFLDANVREGRSFDRRRAFALAAMDEARERFGVPEPNMKVVFTEHAGDQMMGYDRVGSDWEPGEEEPSQSGGKGL